MTVNIQAKPIVTPQANNIAIKKENNKQEIRKPKSPAYQSIEKASESVDNNILKPAVALVIMAGLFQGGKNLGDKVYNNAIKPLVEPFAKQAGELITKKYTQLANGVTAKSKIGQKADKILNKLETPKKIIKSSTPEEAAGKIAKSIEKPFQEGIKILTGLVPAAAFGKRGLDNVEDVQGALDKNMNFITAGATKS